MGTIRDQLQNLTGSALEAPQLATAGGRVYVSSNAKNAQTDLADVVRFWRGVHVPAYGQPIPGTATTNTGTGDSPILATSTNQTALINGLSLTNNNATTPADVNISIDGVIVAVVNVAPSSSAVVVGLAGMAPFMLVEPQTLSQTVSGVAAGDVAFNVAYSLTVQG